MRSQCECTFELRFSQCLSIRAFELYTEPPRYTVPEKIRSSENRVWRCSAQVVQRSLLTMSAGWAEPSRASGCREWTRFGPMAEGMVLISNILRDEIGAITPAPHYARHAMAATWAVDPSLNHLVI